MLGQAKENTEIAEEKELVKTSAMQAIGKNKNGIIVKENLDEELDAYAGVGKCITEDDNDGIIVTFIDSQRTYLVNSNGEIKEYQKPEPVEIPETGGTVFSRANGIVDIKFLVGTGYTVGEANKPKIEKSEMVPINWNGTNWVVTDEANWDYSYDETEKKWANVMLRDTLELDGMDNEAVQTATISQMKGMTVTTEGSMLVWIPRYCYKITYYSSSDKTGDPIGYSDARGIVDANGKTPNGYPEPVPSIAVDDNYRTHPAFEKDLDQGGWDKRITGIWVGKFETTEKVNGKVTIRPGLQSYTYQTIGTFFTDGQELGIANSHMLKNSEWGAVTYLAESIYGINGNGIILNSAYGCYSGGGSGDAYITNVNQSTTNNVYGIYDMNGGKNEMVPAYIADGNNSYGNIFSSIDDTVNNKTESTKYATVYLMSESNGYGSNYAPNINRKFGDALIEISTGGVATTTWYSDASVFVGQNYYKDAYNAYFVRGGQHSNLANGGPFTFDFASGAKGYYNTFRVCMIVE